jgi:uncharacterized protein (DUF2267 family)
VQYAEFVKAVAARAGLPRDEAETLTRSTLRVLGERLTGGEAEDLRAQLPRELQEDLLPVSEQAEDFDVDEFSRRVAQRTGIDEADAGAAVVAVLATIRDAVSEGEFDDVMSQLGREFAELVDSVS